MTTATQTGFAIAVRYLTGYAVAATTTGEPEWPPHPARLFMALLAACRETGGDEAELEALRWLELQEPPEVFAAPCDVRKPVTVYVPPNDFTAKDPNILPQWRTKKQPRIFPRVRPHEICTLGDTVHFCWPCGLEHAASLDALCDKVTRLGHSSSLVQVWLDDSAVEPAGREHFRPSPRGGLRLRSIPPGSLSYLEDLYRESEIEDHFRLNAAVESSQGKAKKQAKTDYEQRFGRPWATNTPPERSRPAMSASVAYERVTAATGAAKSCFDPALVRLRLSPRDSRYRRLDALAAPRVCRVLRDAVMRRAPDGLVVVSGHEADGSPTRDPHMAVMPLPVVGHSHADGHLLGVAVALPNGIDVSVRRRVFTAIHQVDHLTLGELGVWDVGPVPIEDTRKSLRPSWWTAEDTPSRCWATVTPIAMDRHAKAKDPIARQDEMAGLVRDACAAIGLPKPARVVPFPVSVFRGVPDAGRFPRLKRGDGSKRRQTHALLWFDEPVVGPVLLGAGRFRGWGVCRPYQEGKHR